MLNVVHAPSRAKELAHLEHSFAYRPDIAKTSKLRFAQAHLQPLARQAIAQSVKPSIKIGRPLDGENWAIVIICSRIRKVPATLAAIEKLGADLTVARL